MIPYVSASQITTFRDCARKWYFNKVVGISTPSTPATELGSAVHEALENYLRDGVAFDESEAGGIAQSGAHLLPDDANVEIELSLESMPLTDSPVEVRGFVDAIYPTRHHILDHKTSSNKKYTKTQRELRENVQLILYARAYLERAPDADEVTLTHVYYGTRSRWSKRVDVTLTRDEILEKWSRIRTEIEAMITASDAPNASEVSPNRDACSKYGGCPFAGQCFRAHRYVPKNAEPTNTTTQQTTTNGAQNMTPEERMRALGLAPAKQITQKQPTPTTAPIQKQPAPTPIQAQPAPTPQSMKILYIGCLPIKGADLPISALDAYAEPVRTLCASFQVPHLALVDYGRGFNALAGAVAEMGWADGISAMYLDPLCKEYDVLVSTLSGLADIVIRRL